MPSRPLDQTDPTEQTEQTEQAGPSARPTTGDARADQPTDIPADGWMDVLKRSKGQVKDDHVSLLAAGVAFRFFLALFPGLIAALSIYGLVADPDKVREQVESVLSAVPEEARTIVTDQLSSVASGSGGALGFATIISLLAAIYSASSGMNGLIEAVNVAYDEKETRGFLRLRGLALLLTLGAIVFLVLAVGLIAVLPPILSSVGLGGAASVLITIGRYAGLVLLFIVTLAVVYRYAPDRENPRFSWVGVGALTATVLWILGSVAFGLYVQLFGSYNKTYGALAGVVILLLWLFLTAFVVLLGAEVNSEAELQTAADTTTGESRPMGARGAVKADHAAG